MITDIEWLEWFVKVKLKRVNFVKISIMKTILMKGFAVNVADPLIRNQGWSVVT